MHLDPWLRPTAKTNDDLPNKFPYYRIHRARNEQKHGYPFLESKLQIFSNTHVFKLFMYNTIIINMFQFYL